MKKKLLGIASLFLLAALLVGWYLWAPAQAPVGQPPLMHLSAATYADLRASFNKASSGIRIVALLSPT